MEAQFKYAIVKEYYPEIERESTLLESPHRVTDFILIEKVCFDNGTERINKILYLNSLNVLVRTARTYPSYYIYPINEKKDLQGFITYLE